MPRVKRIEKTVFKFDELSQDARDRAMGHIAEFQVDHEWWEFVFDDAKRAGIKIREFDLDRRQMIKGELLASVDDSVDAILKDHGKDCETYKTAMVYKEAIDKIDCAYRLGAIDEDERNAQVEELEPDYLERILEDYRIILQHEYDYLTSEKAIRETIEANEYEFDERGNLA